MYVLYKNTEPEMAFAENEVEEAKNYFKKDLKEIGECNTIEEIAYKWNTCCSSTPEKLVVRKYHNMCFEELLEDGKLLFMPQVKKEKTNGNDLEITKVFEKEEDAIDFINMVMDGYIYLNEDREVPYMKDINEHILYNGYSFYMKLAFKGW